jgi:hypothetical protein
MAMDQYLYIPCLGEQGFDPSPYEQMNHWNGAKYLQISTICEPLCRFYQRTSLVARFDRENS